MKSSNRPCEERDSQLSVRERRLKNGMPEKTYSSIAEAGVGSSAGMSSSAGVEPDGPASASSWKSMDNPRETMR